MPVRRYNVSQIDEGVKLSIRNSEYLLEVARLLEQGHLKSAIIFHTYAIEEFGKALMLEEKKLDACKKGEDEVEDKKTFSSHELKIAKALALLGSWGLPAGIKSIEKPTTPYFKDLKDLGDFATEKNRVNLLLVDYDDKEKEWVDPSVPWMHDVEAGINALEEGLKRWNEGIPPKSSGQI